MNPPHIVIIGAGFGGLYAAKELCAAEVRVTVLDRSNYHLFQPLLYQVATTALSPGEIAQPIRRIFRKCSNVEVFLAEVTDIDLSGRKVKWAKGETSYDYLIVAAGVTHAYFGHDEWAKVAPGLKTLEDAIRMRRMFLTAFEEAEQDPDRREALMNFVIVGAGPTGVELAGTMSEVAKRVIRKDFRHIDPSNARIVLLEGGARILPGYPADLSASAQRQLEKLGVEVRTGALVTRIEKGRVHIGDEIIETERVFWAAGVAASPLGKTLGAPLDRFGRVPVQPDLSITGHPEVFVIGDLAALDDASGKPVPGVAPAAMQMGRYAARLIRAKLRGKSLPPFVYKDKGNLATIGRAAAIAHFPRFQFSGFFAWIAWLLIHIYFLIGFRNRLVVMIQWAWAYIGLHSSTRLITYYEPESGSGVET